MNKLVIYTSSTGFTKQYANWIAKELKAEVKELKKVKANEIEQYECIIYGGWIMGNMIMGLDKIKKMNPKNLVVFAVGASPDSHAIREAIKVQNHLENIPFYYFEGGFRFEKLNFMVRMMLKTLKKSTAKKENKTEQELYMEKVLGTSFDHADKKYIAPLITEVKAI